ncbi:hypothetical protein DUI87_16639 [Hirundo rustica rustica]|uniref:Uncharacterized protein n=1 Tax=Hirundo rustica rustica TaxID=333673 RepID=A0A3M0K1Z3_HIRRU|nr:hypothetical protein DUI87_16639 [Hirundo rustica rustica]
MIVSFVLEGMFAIKLKSKMKLKEPVVADGIPATSVLWKTLGYIDGEYCINFEKKTGEKIYWLVNMVLEEGMPLLQEGKQEKVTTWKTESGFYTGKLQLAPKKEKEEMKALLMAFYASDWDIYTPQLSHINP